LPVLSDHLGHITLLTVISAPIIETGKFSQEHCGNATELTYKTCNFQHAWPVLFQDQQH
jgi:hypothetical protein